MPKYVDEDGNEIELAVPITDLQKSAEELKKTAAELEEAKARLAKNENKEMNWKKLSTRTEAEIKALSARELEILQRQEALEDQQQQFTAKQREGYKAAALGKLGITSDDDKKKALAQYERLKDEAMTEEEVFNKMRDAVSLEKSLTTAPRVNPVFNNGGIGHAPTPQQNTEISGELKELANKMGVTDEDIKKYNK